MVGLDLLHAVGFGRVELNLLYEASLGECFRLERAVKTDVPAPERRHYNPPTVFPNGGGSYIVTPLESRFTIGKRGDTHIASPRLMTTSMPRVFNEKATTAKVVSFTVVIPAKRATPNSSGSGDAMTRPAIPSDM